MNELWSGASRWLVQTLAGGGLILLLTCVLLRWTRQPARRQRLGDFGVAAALAVAVLSLVGPSWLVVAGTPAAPARSAVVFRSSPLLVDSEFADAATDEERPAAQILPGGAAADLPASPRETAAAPAEDIAWHELAARAGLTAFAAVAVLFALRLALGYLGLVRLLVRSEAAPAEVRGLFEAMAAGTRWVRLLVSRRLLVPLSCGLVRPTVVLPAQLCRQPAPRQLRWIFAHELTHLRRRDAWSALLFGLGQVLFFALPWFWWLRRQVRLCQEYVADAAAAGEDEQGEYAAFLVSLASSPAVPAGAAAVSGDCSDLARRVTMLLKSPLRVETACPRRWTAAVAGGLLALAVLLSGFAYRAEAAPDDPVVLVLQDGQPQQAEKKIKVRVYLDRSNSVNEHIDDIILWRYTLPEDKAQDREAKQAQADIIVERLAQNEAWAYRIKHGDDLTPLRDALKRLEQLKEQGKLTTERIHLEVLKALLDMKAQPARPLFDRPIHFKLRADKEGTLYVPKELTLRLDNVKLGELGTYLRVQQEETTPETVKAALQWLLKQQGEPAENIEIEVVPFRLGNKGRLAIATMQTPEDLYRLITAAKVKTLINLVDIDQQEVKRPRLGVSVEAISPAIAEHLNLPAKIGVLITEVYPGTPAEKVGLKVNDILVQLDGALVPADTEEFVKLVASLKGGVPLDVVVVRKGSRLKLGKVTLGETPAASAKVLAEWLLTIDNEPATGRLLGKHGDGTTITITDRGELLTLKHQQGGSTVVLNCIVKDGKVYTGGVEVHSGKENASYPNIQAVPQEYRARAERLVELSGKLGGAKDQ